jgi:hypothetical protein
MEHENMGWQCPCCRVVYSPAIPTCLCQTLEDMPNTVAGFPVSVGSACRPQHWSDPPPECGKPWQTKSYFEKPYNLPKPPKYPGRDDGMENV